jgi:hypothetical protein
LICIAAWLKEAIAFCFLAHPFFSYHIAHHITFLVPSMSKRKDPGRAFELISLGRASYASHSGISKLLAHISEHGLPETFDSSAQYRARKEICRQTPCQYGPLVVDLEMPLEKGGHTTMSFQNPLAFFHYACAKSAHYSRIVSEALDNHPCTPASPWNLVIYQDGVDPSDGLAKTTRANQQFSIGASGNSAWLH